MARCSGCPVERSNATSGLALVGDADGRHGVAPLGQAAADLGQRGPTDVPQISTGVVLDPARARENAGVSSR